MRRNFTQYLLKRKTKKKEKEKKIIRVKEKYKKIEKTKVEGDESANSAPLKSTGSRRQRHSCHSADLSIFKKITHDVKITIIFLRWAEVVRGQCSLGMWTWEKKWTWRDILPLPESFLFVYFFHDDFPRFLKFFMPNFFNGYFFKGRYKKLLSPPPRFNGKSSHPSQKKSKFAI